MPRYHYKEFRNITALARDLRKNMTASEKLMWEILRRKEFIGFRFLRQRPLFYRIDRDWIDFYIADFYCAELRLVIELDGPVHDYQTDYDSERDSKIEAKGIQVLRIRNEQLMDINSVIAQLKISIIKRSNNTIV